MSWRIGRWRRPALAGLGAAVLLSAGAGLAAAGPAAADAGGESVAYQVDPAHDGSLGVTYAPRLTRRWADTFSGTVTYPLVVGGRAYVIAPATSGSGGAVFALTLATGARLWEHPVGGRGVGLAYDGGRVFVVDGGGLLTALDAASGNVDWSGQLPGQYAFSAPPTATGGIVYVGGAGEGGTLYAVKEATGALIWSRSVQNGDTSSPAVDARNVYVTYPGQYYAFSRATGAPVWYDDEGIEGGGGWTAVVADGHVYARDSITSPKILSAATGAVQAPFGSTTVPAVGGGVAYQLDGATLQAVPDAGLGSIGWSFAGDGRLDTAPLLTGSTVWVGSSSGELYAVDAATGHLLSSTTVGTAISAPDEYSGPLTGMAAGDDSLLVDAGSTLVAFTATATGSGTGAAAARLRAGIVARVRIGRLLARRAVRLRVTLPAAGRLSVTWSARTGRARRWKAIAAGRLRVRRGGRHVIVLRVTVTGRRVLRAARRALATRATAAFVPAHGARIAVARSFRLTR